MEDLINAITTTGNALGAILIRMLAQVPNTKDYENAWSSMDHLALSPGGNIPNVTRLDRESRRNVFGGDVVLVKQPPDYAHVIVRDPALWMVRPKKNPAASATFGVSILDIVHLRSEKQVIRPHATRIVAMVTNAHAFGNRAVGQLPRQAMRPRAPKILRQ
jgi:hypothetical protein